MQKVTARPLAEGALLAAITAILALAGTFIPLASFFTYLVVAVPIIIVIVRNDFTTGVISSLVAAFLVGVLAGPLIALMFYIQFMSMALVYGYMIRKKIGAGKILVVGTFVASITTVILIALTMLVGQVGLEQQKEILFNTVDQTIEIYEQYGMLDNFEEQGIDKEELRIMLTDMIKLFIRVLPSLLIIGSVFTAITHFIMARIALKRLGYEVSPFPSFSRWRLPWYTIWGLIIGWGSFLLGDFYQMELWNTVGQNIMIAYAMLLFVLGLSVISFYLKRYKFTIIGRLLILLFAIMFLNGTIIVTVLAGMFDLVLDLRKINQEAKPS